jgi:nicotinate phosphoribosyltransferase
MAFLRLTASERQYLEENCPYLKPPYLDYLSRYQFKPGQVTIQFQPNGEPVAEGACEKGRLTLFTDGSWLETILWEVPLMSALSESCFECDDTDWDYEGQEGKLFPYPIYALD